MRYKMAKLIKMAENELRRLGFMESTIKDQYSKYWHIMLTDIGDKEVSKDDFVNACIRHYGIDIMNTPFNELTTYHSRMKSKSLCLLEFQDRGFIDGKPYSSRPKQMLSETMLNLIQDFLDIQKQSGNSDFTIENKRSRIAYFVNRYPLNSLSTDSILHYVDSLKRHERIGAREKMSIIRNFLEFAYKCGRIPASYSELFPKFRIRRDTSRPSVYSADEIEVISRYRTCIFVVHKPFVLQSGGFVRRRSRICLAVAVFQSIQDFCENKTVVFLLPSGFSLRPVCGNVQAPDNLYTLFFGRCAVCFLREYEAGQSAARYFSAPDSKGLRPADI